MASPNLSLALLTEGATNSESTANAALLLLDALVACRVEDRDLTAPPGSPADGKVWIVGASATGDWAGQDGNLAIYNEGWTFVAPHGGMVIFVQDEVALLYYDSSGSAWTAFSGGGGMSDLVDDTTPQLGGNLDTNGNKIQGAQQTLTFVASSVNISTPAPAVSSTAELVNSTGSPMRVDLTGFTQARISVMRGSTTRANLTMAIKYKTGAPTGTYGDYSELGASTTEVEIACPTANTFFQSSWISLVSGAIADDISLAMCWTNGDSGSNVALQRVTLEIR